MVLCQGVDHTSKQKMCKRHLLKVPLMRNSLRKSARRSSHTTTNSLSFPTGEYEHFFTALKSSYSQRMHVLTCKVLNYTSIWMATKWRELFLPVSHNAYFWMRNSNTNSVLSWLFHKTGDVDPMLSQGWYCLWRWPKLKSPLCEFAELVYYHLFCSFLILEGDADIFLTSLF